VIEYDNVSIDCGPWLKEGSIVRLKKGRTLTREEPDDTPKKKELGIPPGQLYVISSSFAVKSKCIVYFHPNIPMLYVKNTAKIRRTRIFDYDLEGEFGSDTFEIQFYFLYENKIYRFPLDYHLEGERKDIHKIITDKRKKIRETFEETFLVLTNT
jgi:hypothetical protein